MKLADNLPVRLTKRKGAELVLGSEKERLKGGLDVDSIPEHCRHVIPSRLDWPADELLGAAFCASSVFQSLAKLLVVVDLLGYSSQPTQRLTRNLGL